MKEKEIQQTLQTILNDAVSNAIGEPVSYFGWTIGGWITMQFPDGREIGTFTDKDGVKNRFPNLFEQMSKILAATIELHRIAVEWSEWQEEREEARRQSEEAMDE